MAAALSDSTWYRRSLRGADRCEFSTFPPTCALPVVQYVEGSVLDPGLVDESLRGVDQVYHLAGLPGMWMPHKSDFHTVNCQGTEIVITAARRRGIARFLHCSTESILFRSSPSQNGGSEYALLPADEMSGRYTRSKMLAEQFAMQAAASDFPVVIGSDNANRTS